MLTAENLFPRPVKPAQPTRVVSGWLPEDLAVETVDDAQPTDLEIIMAAMKAEPHEVFCGTDFPEIEQRRACGLLKRLKDRGFIEFVGKRNRNDGGGRPASYFRWTGKRGWV